MPDLTGHLTARADDGHAPPLSSSGKVISLAFILLSPRVRFPALTPIKPQASPLVVPPRQLRGRWKLDGQTKRTRITFIVPLRQLNLIIIFTS